MSSASPEKSQTQEGQVRNLHSLQFPWKLHRLLEECERNGDSDVISWLPGFKAFKVHKRKEFSRRIMPTYFSSAKYKTFQRSLNLWGFESVPKGLEKGACYHKFFIRGHPNLCENMRRIKIKGHQVTTAKAAQPKFASIAPPAIDSPIIAAPQATDKPVGVSDFIRSKRTSVDLSAAAVSDSLTAPRTYFDSDLLFKAAIDQRRREALMRMSFPLTLPSFDLGTLSMFQRTPVQRTDPLQTVALAAALASKVIHEV